MLEYFKAAVVICVTVLIIVNIIRSMMTAIKTGEWRSWLNFIRKAEQPIAFWCVIGFYTIVLIVMSIVLAVVLNIMVRLTGLAE